jgi:hypothetical protein
VDLEGVRWRKSSRSSGHGDDTDCVEVAMIDSGTPTRVPAAAFAAIRDSKNPGPALVLPQNAWSGLVYRLEC